MTKDKDNRKLQCPYCYGVIINAEELKVNKKYRCTKCNGTYFIVRVAKEIYFNYLNS